MGVGGWAKTTGDVMVKPLGQGPLFPLEMTELCPESGDL